MFLADQDIEAALEAGDIAVDPLSENSINAASIELHVGLSMARWRNETGSVYMAIPKRIEELDDHDYEITRNMGEGSEILIRPGEMILLAVLEHITLSRQHVGLCSGKSTTGRSGIQFENAGWVDPGYDGVLTGEVVNQSPRPLLLLVGAPIAQIIIAELKSPARRVYGHPSRGSRYQGDRQVQPPRRATGYWTPGIAHLSRTYKED